MRIVDVNVLLHAVNTDSDRHDESRTWLDESLSGAAPVGFASVALLGFVRLASDRRVFPQPLAVDTALDIVDTWLGAPGAVDVRPGPDHHRVLRRLLAAPNGVARLVTDAHLAALAIEAGGTVVTYDSDFGRFDGVRWAAPGQL